MRDTKMQGVLRFALALSLFGVGVVAVALVFDDVCGGSEARHTGGILVGGLSAGGLAFLLAEWLSSRRWIAWAATALTTMATLFVLYALGIANWVAN